MDIGLYDYNGRYYAPTLARFLSPDTLVPDPANPQEFNRYAYSLNNPVKYRDSSGHCAETGDDGCWGWYDRTMQMCPECRNLGWEMWGAGFQEEMYYIVKDGWRPSYNTDFSLDAIGVVGSIGGGTGVGGQAAVELVFNLHNGDITLFAIVGGGYVGGEDLSGDVTIELIFNIGDDNLNYKGVFHYAEVGAAAGTGLVGGHAWTPLDLKRKEPYSVYAGPKVGASAYVAGGRVEYIPIATTNLQTGETTFHADDYLYGDMAPVNDLNEFLSPTGPYRALYDALETAISEHN